jgi:hypothetical protein
MSTNSNNHPPASRRDGLSESSRSGAAPIDNGRPQGGQVPRRDYEDRTPRPPGTPNTSLPFRHRNDRS